MRMFLFVFSMFISVSLFGQAGLSADKIFPNVNVLRLYYPTTIGSLVRTDAGDTNKIFYHGAHWYILTEGDGTPDDSINIITCNGYTVSQYVWKLQGVFAVIDPKGQSGKVPKSDGVGVTWFTPKRQETYSGTTNSSGLDTITFTTPYVVAPDVKASILNAATGQFVRVYNISTTGCRVHAYAQGQTTLLSTLLLLASTVNINGATVNILVTEK